MQVCPCAESLQLVSSSEIVSLSPLTGWRCLGEGKWPAATRHGLWGMLGEGLACFSEERSGHIRGLDTWQP